MSVIDFKITEEEVPLHHSIKKEKTVRHTVTSTHRTLWKKNRVGICLLLVELCEKFTFFEVICNMIPFSTVRLGYCNYQAAILNLCFIGTSIFTPVFVGWFADVCLGRNKLAYICLFLHLLGECPPLTGLFCKDFSLEFLVYYYFYLILSIKCNKWSKDVFSNYFIFCIIWGMLVNVVCVLGHALKSRFLHWLYFRILYISVFCTP